MFWSLFFLALVVLAGWLVAQWLTGRGGLFTTVYEWHHALLYRDGRFSRLLPPGRYFRQPVLPQHDIYLLRKTDIDDETPVVDVTSADNLLFRLSAAVTYRITDPRTAFENEYVQKIRQAAADALVTLAAQRELKSFIAERAASDAALAALIPSPVCGCEIITAKIRTVTLPPELRRLFVEIERARLESIAALERARGEQATLRSLANTASVLKGNPELMNLRILQTMSAAAGKNQLTLVLGESALAASASVDKSAATPPRAAVPRRRVSPATPVVPPATPTAPES